MIEIFYIILLLSLTILIGYSTSFIQTLKRKAILDKYPELLAILDVAKEVSYNKIFRESILVHSASGVKLNSREIDEVSKKYLRLVFRCAGAEVIDNLKRIHGDLESLSIILINEFVQKIGDDENRVIGSVLSDQLGEQPLGQESLE